MLYYSQKKKRGKHAGSGRIAKAVSRGQKQKLKTKEREVVKMKFEHTAGQEEAIYRYIMKLQEEKEKKNGRGKKSK